KEATAESVRKVNAEVVVIATGATALIPQLPGIGGKNVVTGVDLLMGRAQVGDRVIVAGGGVTGCEIGVWLAQKGKKVTIVEMMGQLIPEQIHLANRIMLLEMVKNSGVASVTGARIEKVTAGGVVIREKRATRELAGDSVVLALGLTPQSQLKDSLKNVPFAVSAIGDCVKTGKIFKAIWEGFHAARLL
ncbi:MAG: FAD-dependent oxidoreductase, partial [Chloroflexota bacterium]